MFDDNKYVSLIFKENKIPLNFLMELKYLENNKFIQYITIYICLELYYLHLNNIVHNNIKLSKILYWGNLFISLCDFGAMRYEGEIPNEYIKHYDASEHFYNNDKRNLKSDMWSLGVIMIEIIR